LLGPEIYSAKNGGEVTGVSPAGGSAIRVILLDIEGTTTTVDFVYKTLFPYASRKLESFLREHSKNPEFQPLIRELHAQHESDERHGLQPPNWHDNPDPARIDSAAGYGQWLMARDSKCMPLKLLQGKIWQQGYASGELHGEVFPDVPVAFERWRRQNRKICIYSSGSVLAQQLLFRTSTSGDLTTYIYAFFDTGVGAKTEKHSYKKIAAALSQTPEQFLFISDAVKEIEAAKSVGMQTRLCVREEHPPEGADVSGVIHDFHRVFPD
jgi:enolase-phosphatase E1